MTSHSAPLPATTTLSSSDESESDHYSDADCDIAFMKCSLHLGNLLSSLKKLRCDDSFCDVTIKCGNFEMTAHRNILASATDYFRAMFLNDTKEAGSGVVNFSEMSPEIVKQTIEFIYSGEIGLSMACAKDLLDASEMLQLPELSKLCVEFLAKKLSLGTCAKIIALSNRYGKKSLNFPIAEFLGRSFEDFHKTEDFKSLDLDSLIYCLNLLQDGSSDHEIMKWRGIITWVGYDSVNRSSELIQLLSVMEWSYLSNEFILKQVCAYPLINESTECLRLLTEVAFGRKTLRECKEQQTQVTDILAFNRESRLLFQYSLKAELWAKIARYPTHFPSECDIIHYKGLLCVGNGTCIKIFLDSTWKTAPDHSMSQGQSSLNSVKTNSNSGFWFARPKSSGYTVTQHTSNTCDDSIYCRCFGLGDYIYMMTASSLGSYHISSTQWAKNEISIGLGRGFFCAVSHNTIYAMGGEGSAKKCIEIKVSSKTHQPINNMITPKENGHAFWYDGKLCAFGGHYPAVLECYFPVVDRWCIVDSLKIPKNPAKVYVLNDMLYLVGGEYGENITNISLKEFLNINTPKCPVVDMFTACSITCHQV